MVQDRLKYNSRQLGLRIISTIAGIFLLLRAILGSFLNPFWWFSKKINPYSEYERLPDRICAFLFRLDIFIQNIYRFPVFSIRRRWISRLKNHFFKNEQVAGTVIPVKEFDYRTRDLSEFADQLNKEQQPIKLTGFLKTDPFYQEWSFNDFVSKYGDEEVVLSCPVFDGYPGPLKDLNIPGIYLHNSECLLEKHPQLLRKMGISYLAKLMGKSFYFADIAHLYAGRGGTGTGYHSEGGYNCFLMLSGQKKWTLINPEDTPLLFPRGSGDFSPLYYYPDNVKISLFFEKYYKRFKDLDIEGPDWKLPVDPDHALAFSKAIDRYEVVLNPGDMLLIPPYWWHEIENLSSESIAGALRWGYRVLRPSTNKVFEPFLMLGIRRFISFIYSGFTQDLFTSDGDLILENKTNLGEKVKEQLVPGTRAAKLVTPVFPPSDLIREYYEKARAEPQ